MTAPLSVADLPGLGPPGTEAGGKAMRLASRARIPASEAIEPVNVAGGRRPVPLVPKHRASLGLHWEFRPDTRLSVTGRYVGEQVMENDEPNTCGRRIPAYATADLRVSHRHGPFTVAVVVNNQG